MCRHRCWGIDISEYGHCARHVFVWGTDSHVFAVDRGGEPEQVSALSVVPYKGSSQVPFFIDAREKVCPAKVSVGAAGANHKAVSLHCDSHVELLPIELGRFHAGGVLEGPVTAGANKHLRGEGIVARAEVGVAHHDLDKRSSMRQG